MKIITSFFASDGVGFCIIKKSGKNTLGSVRCCGLKNKKECPFAIFKGEGGLRSEFYIYANKIMKLQPNGLFGKSISNIQIHRSITILTAAFLDFELVLEPNFFQIFGTM